MLRRNQTGTIAMQIIKNRPTANRFICGSAHGVMEPPATEYNIKKPTLAIVVSNTIIGQFKCNIFDNPLGTDLTLYSR
jgi:hypothetical protein